jgi:large subunit ribosomal protein L24
MYSGRIRAMLQESGVAGFKKIFQTGDGSKPIKPLKKWKFVLGDVVQVITGVDKGKRGKITEIIKDKNKVVVEGLNMQTRIQRATIETRAQMVLKEKPMHVSNVMLIDPETDKPTRFRKVYLPSGKPVRLSKKSGVTIPKPPQPPQEPPPLVTHEFLTTPEAVLKQTYVPVTYTEIRQKVRSNIRANQQLQRQRHNEAKKLQNAFKQRRKVYLKRKEARKNIKEVKKLVLGSGEIVELEEDRVKELQKRLGKQARR